MRYRNALAPALSFALLVACGEPDAVETPDVRGSAAPTPEPVASSEVEAAPALETPIGFAAVPAPRGREEAEALREARALHRRGDFTASRDAFVAIVQAHPDDDEARFELACVQARLGALGDAASELSAVLSRDLPRYRRRLDEDDDLRALRDAPQGAAIRRRIAALDAQWRRAAEAGIPTVAWRRASDGSLLRAGAYLPEARRFLPLGPRSGASNAVLADPEVGKVVLVSLDSDDGRAHLEVHSLFGETGAFATHDFTAIAIEAHATEEGARYRATREPQDVLQNQVWRDLTSGRRGDRAADSPSPGRRRLIGWGTPRLQPAGIYDVSWNETRFGDIALRGNTLVPADGAPIALSRGHAMAVHPVLALSPDRRILFIASTTSGCRHVIDRVDLVARTMTPIGAGPGLGYVHIAPDGETFVQRGEALVVLARFDAELAAAEPALEGVLLDRPCR